MGKQYIIKSIFPTLQGEGRWAGTPAVFVRFAGCNLACPWCDTDFKGGTPMTLEQIVERVTQAATVGASKDGRITHLVWTGGEPGVQLDRDLVRTMREKLGFTYQQIETNGTQPQVLDLGLDWITCSPKEFEKGGAVRLRYCNELKYVTWVGEPLPVPPAGLFAQCKYLSPRMDHTKDGREAVVWENIDWAVGLAHANPEWRLTMQLHKIWGIA